MSADARHRVEIGELEPAERERAAEILARAFAGEQMHAYLLGKLSREQRERVLLPYFETLVELARPPTIVHAARLDGRLVGVRFMTPSDAPPPSFADRLRQRAAFTRLVARAPSYARARRLLGSLPRPETGRNWRMEYLAVDPAVEGTGTASTFMNQGRTFLDEQHASCTFATCTQVIRDACLRRGWVVVAERQPLPGGPTEWLMLREAQPAP